MSPPAPLPLNASRPVVSPTTPTSSTERGWTNTPRCWMPRRPRDGNDFSSIAIAGRMQFRTLYANHAFPLRAVPPEQWVFT